MAADLAFWSCAGGRRAGQPSSRLAALASASAPYDPGAIAARALMGLPAKLGETPYRDICCELREEDAPLRDAGGAAEAAAGEDDARAATSAKHGAKLLRAALGRAVDRALSSVRRVAVMTGGGLDSATLLALASDWARRSGGSAFAVALDFASDGDDRPHLRALESALGCEVVRVRPEDGAHRIDLMRGVDAAPFGGPTAMMEVELMARARAMGADCVLMGVGGDEIFDGEPRALAGLARRGRLREAFAAARSLRGFDRPRSPVAAWIVRPLLAGLVPARARLHHARARRPRPRVPVWAGARLRAAVEEAAETDLAAAASSVARGEDPAVAPRSLDARYREYLAWGRHAQSVAAGVRRVDPYLDRTLIATIARLPADWLLHGDVRRGLLRLAMTSALPDSVRLREDKARFEPALVRFVTAAGGLASLRPLASATHLARHGLVEPSAFSDAFADFVAAPHEGEAWTTLWPALCLEAFLRDRDASS